MKDKLNFNFSKNMFNFLKLHKIHYVNGVLPDERPPEEKQKDWLTEEIMSPQPLKWITWEEWRKDPLNKKMLDEIEVNNQGNTPTCASQAGSLALAINNYLEDGKFIKFSAKPVYARRRNKPRRGMYMDDLAKILTTYGTVPEVLYPSPNDTEENMSNLDGYISAFEAFGKILRAKNYFWLYNTRDIDSFARVLSLGKPIVLTVVFGDGEFGTSVPVVKPVQLKYGHAIVALQHAYFTYKGKKAILIQNSWGKNLFIGGRQILTADWFNKNRIICGIWLDDLDNLSVFNSQHLNKLPHYEFKKDLYVGCRGSDVAMLQTVLAMIKDDKGYLFPLWQGQAPTGYYGGITRQAMKRFQIAHNITPTLGYFGPKTRTKLNKMLK